ncbi:lipopolysaccharide biosynthesis protein [Photobacterium leiognathi]|uniref:lipopolysaccharide biosynthesis protein n=1 Tax=Photobacterium leiognathi TaxID=553611 RepID=UPI002981F1B1|nr:oligosaccharide flippase family protein [Photobacterium leiognathi]
MLNKLKENGFVNFFHFFIGDLFIKGLLFITLPLLTFFLNPSDYGHLSVLSTLVTILAVIFSLNTENSIINYYMKGEKDFGSYLFSNLVSILFFQLIILTIIILFKEDISQFFGVSTSDLLWASFICVVILYFNIYLSYLQGSEKSKKFAVVTTANKIIEISIMLTFAYLLSSSKYMSKVYAQLIAIFIFLPYCLYSLLKLCEFRYDFKLVKKSLIFSIPLIPHVLSSAIIGQSDRLMIGKMLSLSDAGIYSFAYNLGLSITVFIYAWNSMWQPKFFSFYKNKNFVEIEKFIIMYSKVISFSSLLLIVTIYPLVKFFANVEYIDSLKLIPLLLLSNSIVFQYLVYVNYIFYYRKSFRISIGSLIAAIVNVAINYFLIPEVGVLAAVLSTFISSVVLVLIHYYNSKRLSDDPVINLFDAFKWYIPLFILTSLFYVYI